LVGGVVGGADDELGPDGAAELPPLGAGVAFGCGNA
jgi:hypothetical protein